MGCAPAPRWLCPRRAGVNIGPHRLLAFGPMLRGSVGPTQIMRGVDQCDMRESLRVVSHLPPCRWIVFFGEQTEIVAQREQPIEQCAGVIVPALQNVVVGEPKAAG